MPKKHTNPAGVSKPAGFSHVVEATGATRFIYVAGQTATNAAGEVVGVGDFRAQVQQVYENLKTCLESHGASFADVMKTTTFVVNFDAATHRPVLNEMRSKYLSDSEPPASTLLGVQGLARPELLVEIEAVAIVQPSDRVDACPDLRFHRSMPLRIEGLTHVALQVRDLDRSLRFYQALFGSEVSHRDETTIELRTPGRRDALTLVRFDAPEAGSDGGVGTSHGGVLHFGFRLIEPMAADDIAIAVTQAGGVVQDKGQFVLGEPYVFARDPDGYLLEIFFEP